jgi:hypothetical protein
VRYAHNLVLGSMSIEPVDLPSLEAVLRFAVYPPLDLANRYEWPISYPPSGVILFKVWSHIYLLAFWFVCIAIAGLLNDFVVRTVRLVRPPRHPGGPHAADPEKSTSRASARPKRDRRRFYEVQYFSRFLLGVIVFYASVSGFADLIDLLEGTIYQPTAGEFIAAGAMAAGAPILFFSFKLITAVSDGELRLRLSPFFLRRRLPLSEIVRSELISQASVKHVRPRPKAFSWWARRGVLIKDKSGLATFIGSKRPEELLEALRLDS